MVDSNSSLGGGIPGISPAQTTIAKRNSNDVMIRRIVTKSWNTGYSNDTYNKWGRAIGPYRAVTNLGDFLNRTDYVCGGSNQINVDRYKRKNNIGSMLSRCDETGVPASVCNVKFVSDSSNYTTFRKQQAINQNYNDSSFVGDDHHGNQQAWFRMRL